MHTIPKLTSLRVFAIALALHFCAISSLGQSSLEEFKDTTDGAIDISDFLLSVSGFLPVPVIITEPAVGFGGGLFGAYFHKKENLSSTISRPDITIAGGGGTENGTWFAGGGHLGFWKNDRIRYKGFLFYAQPTLTFYSFKNIETDIAINTNMKMWFLMQSFSFRIKNSNWFVGADYIFNKSETQFEASNNPLVDNVLDKVDSELTNSGLGAIFIFDSRDNLYTANKGFYWQNNLRYFPTWLGSTAVYGTFDTDVRIYIPVYKKKVFLTLANTFSLVFDNAPFYTYPFVNMRGVKAMRYQGVAVNMIQAEGRFNFYKRWSIVGFGGVGMTSPSLRNMDFSERVWAGGTGFRYLIARLFGMQTGLDFAWSEKDPLTGENQFAFYIVMGASL